MIKSVTVTNYLNESITLDLRHPERTGIFVARIEGLGPPTATINVAELSTHDGGIFNSSRAGVRNILLTLGFLEQPTIEDVRIKTYKYFPIKKKLKLTITTDKRTLEIYGYVESNEPDIFARQTATQISILCPDPYFYSEKVSNTMFSGAESLFEFPFSNESLTDNLLEFSALYVDKEQTVVYEGDTEIGIQIHIHALGTAKNITIYNTRTKEIMRIDHERLVALTGEGIKYGDDIIISTVSYNKSVTLLREGVYYNILNVLDRDTDWFKLRKGDNIFMYTAESGESNLQFKILNQVAFEGV